MGCTIQNISPKLTFRSSDDYSCLHDELASAALAVPGFLRLELPHRAGNYAQFPAAQAGTFCKNRKTTVLSRLMGSPISCATSLYSLLVPLFCHGTVLFASGSYRSPSPLLLPLYRSPFPVWRQLRFMERLVCFGLVCLLPNLFGPWFWYRCRASRGTM